MNDIEHEYEVTLIDDGTLDTVVSVEGTEYRYNWDPEPDSDESYDDFAAWAMDEMSPMTTSWNGQWGMLLSSTSRRCMICETFTILFVGFCFSFLFLFVGILFVG
jgi:hypothetical protein